MSSFGRFTDILVAFLGMFILPLVFLNYEEVNRLRYISEKKAEAFLEITANSGEISEEVLSDLNISDSPEKYGCIFELTVTRNEFFPDNPSESITVSFSQREVLSLLSENPVIHLRAGDRVSVRVYAVGLFGRKTYLLTEIGKTV